MRGHFDGQEEHGHQPSGSTMARVFRLVQVSLLLTLVPPSRAGGLPVIIDVDPCPQCRVVGPDGLSEITVTFNTDVNVGAGDVSVRTRASMGANVGFSLSGTPGSDTFTIVLDEAVESDMVTVVIDYTITSVGTAEALDGEMSDPRSLVLPSGDGLPGGQAVLQFAVLQGDVDGSGATNIIDLQLVLDPLNQGEADLCDCSLADPGFRLDVNGDLVVDSADVDIVNAAQGLFIPQVNEDALMVTLLPVGGETVCGELDTVTADFNESLAPETVTATTLFALDPDGELQASSSATLGGDDDMIDYTFDPPLSINVDYDFTLSESIMDPSGELLDRTLFTVSTSEPIIDVDPIGQTVCELDSAEFTVVASGVGELSYQWRKDSVNLDGEIADTLTIDPADIDDAGDYDVVITDGALCTATSAPATLTVNAVPTIDSQPDTVSVCDGAQAQFSVGASGAGTLSYQWRKGGIDIDGADADTLIIDPAGADDAGDYDVVITDESMCSTVSDTATLTVSPTIITQPEGMAATEGETVELTVVAEGADPLAYQWSKDDIDLEEETAATLTLAPAVIDDAGVYNVLVTDDDGCSILSEAATLTVDVAPVGPPEIQTQPTTQSACEGDSVEFTVDATGGAGPLAYQWTGDGEELEDGGNISGATTNTLTLDPVDADDDDTSYAVTISNDDGAVTSDSAELTVSTDVPTITSQPTDETVIEGDAAVFSVTASGLAPVSYQWRMDGSDLAGAIGTILTIPGADSADAGDYDVVVTDGNGCSAVSDTVTLTIGTEPTSDDGVTIESHPVSQTVCEGDGVTLSVSATGTADLTYQWSMNGVEIAGATGSTLTIDLAEIGDAGDYTVEVSDGTDSLNSNTATLAVAQSPTIITSPASQTIDAGAAVTFSVTADGTEPLSYQWSVDGAIIVGATGATLSLTSGEASSADGRVYQVTVTNDCGSATSLAATLTVNGDGGPTVGDPVPGDDSTGNGSPCGLFDIFGLIMLLCGLAGLSFGRSRSGH
ncbi:MAG: immunoglobulin domain-containing protein [Planctomycetes bacterium]|nr:immunoglobulin domain-containing protein [Planctomycetota bacterium]